MSPAVRTPDDGSGGVDDTVLPERAERRSDLRLLVPAIVGWVVVAALLGRSGPVILGALAVAVVLLGAAVAVARRAGRASTSDEAADGAGPETAGPDPRTPPVPRLLALTAAACVLVVTALAAWTGVRESGPVRELAGERAVVTVDARVATDPRLVPGGSGPAAAPLVIVTLDVESVTGRGLTTPVQDPVLVMGGTELLALRWHEGVRLTGRLSPPDDPADDVVAVLSPQGRPTPVAEAGVLADVADTVRSRFRAATAHLPTDARGLLPGLVLGDTSQTPADLTAAMQATGMTHLSAVSGSNVSFVLAAGLGLCALVGVRRRGRPVVALLVLLAFVVLVRPEPSVVRAAAMGSVGLLGMSVSRRRDGIPALAAAILALLAWDPWLARSYGFALSTLATLGLLVFAAPWGAAIAARLPHRLRAVGPALAIPVAAQVVCGPVIVLLQSSVSLVGVVTNLLAAPLVAPATVLGVAVALLSVVWTTGAAWLAWLPALPTLGIAWIARVGADLPWGSIPWPGGAGGAVLLTVLSLGLLLCGPWVVHHSRRRPAMAVGVGLLGLAAGVPTTSVAWPPAGWQYVMCDVGQGDGMVLRSAEGAVVVVDTGPDPALVDGCLRRLGIDRVDAVLLTHDHADHVDGLPGVLDGRSVGTILTDPVDDPPQQAAEVVRWAGRAGVPLTDLYAGDRLGWPGITARVWWPARVIHAGSVPNNASIVLTVEVDGLRLLLLGDVERESAHAVLLALRSEPGVLDAGFDVLKVAHHGSGNRDDELYRSVHAPLALISVGADNDYGHPTPSTLAALRADGFRVLRTDESGDIAVLRPSGGDVAVSTQRGS